MRELALFAGAGGGILGGVLLGWRTVCAVEINAYCARRLMQRQNEGHLPPFPIWDDVCSFDGLPWRGVVDVVSGGFPCQDISVAGKGAGIDGERSGLWGEMARIIGEVRPRFAFVENSPALVTRGLGRVLGDLAALGYDCRWTVLGASDVGAPHRRERFWLVANASNNWTRRREQQQEGSKGARNVAHATCDGRQQGRTESEGRQGGLEAGQRSASVAHADSVRQLQPKGSKLNQRGWSGNGSWWKFEPDVGGKIDGLA